MNILAIDGGASATKWRLAGPGGEVRAEGRAAPLHGHLFSPDAKRVSAAIIADICREISSHGACRSVVAGITGLDRTSDAAEWYRATLGALSHAPTTLVADDLFFVYLGNSAPGEGLLVYGGTGSIGYHLTETAHILRSGGYGYLVDDAGGGFWIGQQALRAWLRSMEGAGTHDTQLDAALSARFGTRSWRDIRKEVYGGGRSMVASLTHQVCAAAALEDATAAGILRAAGDELAGLANRLLAATGRTEAELTFVGGLRACGADLEAGLSRSLAPGISRKAEVQESTVAIFAAIDRYGIDGLQALMGP